MKLIPLSTQSKKNKGKHFVMVSNCDYKWLSGLKWFVVKARTGTLYAAHKENGKTVKMHRFILKLNDPNLVVDHKDFNGLNNQRNNIRICTQSQNTKNNRRLKSHTSSYLGVSWSKIHNKWKVQICCNYKKKHIGLYTSEKEAAKAYDNAAKMYFGEFANLNFKSKNCS